MKRFFACFLAVVITLGLCACTTGGAEDSEATASAAGLHVGYARESILPEGQVNMSGYGNQAHRISSGYLDILAATCIAASDGGNTVLLFSTDTLTAKDNWTAEARAMINQATGVPERNIQIGGTHTHSSPAVGGAEALSLEWKPIYMNALLNAAKKAIADQAPAKMYGSTIETEGLTFVRHYTMSDGSYADSSTSSANLVAHATEANETLMMIKFDREGDKKDIAVMNFQFHPTFIGSESDTNLSADGVGAIRDVFEKETGMHFIYFTGSAGNQNASSRLPGETPSAKGVNQMKQFGQKVCEFAFTAMENMEEIGGTGVGSLQDKLTYTSNDYGLDRLEDAKKAVEMFDKDGNATAATNYAKTLGFASVYECRGIVANASRPASYTMDLDVVRIGNLGFVAAPYEMFSNSAFQIREGSPFKYTLISSITNHYWNYFPTKEAFAAGCYESYTAVFASGIAEATAEKFVEMLKGL